MTGLVAGKVALITGAARGQGRAHAVRLAEQGADIIAVDVCQPIETIPYDGATEADLAETVRLVETFDRRVEARQVDVRDFGALKAAVDEGVLALGQLDIVVANAGVMGLLLKAWELSEQDWDVTIGVNLTGVWHTVKAAIPHMIAQGTGGSVIITSSMAGLRGIANCANYSATKHGLVGLSRTLAKDAGEYGIRVNTVHPGSIPTKLLLHETMYRVFRPDLDEPKLEDCTDAFNGLNILPGTFQQPEDVANAVLWLASDLSRMTTGATLTADGGSSFS
jgi:SDR family mycofactocin-dependent oxidoreductase